MSRPPPSPPPSPVRGAVFNLNATRALLLINPFAARPAYISLFEVPKEGIEDSAWPPAAASTPAPRARAPLTPPGAVSDEPFVTTDKTGMSDRKGFGCVAYAPMDRHILVGCEDGVLRVFHPDVRPARDVRPPSPPAALMRVGTADPRAAGRAAPAQQGHHGPPV